MDDDSPIPNARTQRSEKWTSIVKTEFRDIFSEVEIGDVQAPPEQVERVGNWRRG